jgi:2-polyprenyl-3-methyl-5-hydroxy-6-metoxy-1,4-benzoquinol methylase
MSTVQTVTTPGSFWGFPKVAQDDVPFQRCGPASISDTLTPHWGHVFRQLEETQREFLSVSPHGSDYVWPVDPLHTWSRCWEYPYVFHHILEQAAPGSKVLDFGSGATFFPFAVARQGYAVTCLDNDLKCIRDTEKACSRLSAGSGTVRAVASQGDQMPVADASFDIVYSVSVLEHISEPASLISELHRVLRPGGALVITIDIDHIPGSEQGIGPRRYRNLLESMLAAFEPCANYVPVHPALRLTTLNSPYSTPSRRGLQAVWWAIKQEIAKPLLGRESIILRELGCEGFVFKKG